MSKTASLYLPVLANNQSVTLTSTDTTTAKLCFTAGANDSNVKGIIACSDDTAAINLKVYITRGGTDYLIGVVNIPTLSGTNGTAPAIDVLNAVAFPGLPLDSVGKRIIPMKNGDTLKVGCLVTMTAAKTCTVSILGEDY